MAAMKLGAGQNGLMVPGEVNNNNDNTNNDNGNKNNNKNSNNNK
jgi:hypothetical protein